MKFIEKIKFRQNRKASLQLMQIIITYQLQNYKRIISEFYRINHMILKSIKMVTSRIFLPNNRIVKKFTLRKLTGNLILNSTIMKLGSKRQLNQHFFFFFFFFHIK